jgi:2OG-Fe(II) oxygenase superfamily
MIKVIDNFLPHMYADQLEYEAEHELMYRYRQYTSSIDGYSTEAPLIVTNNTIDYGQFVCSVLHSSYDVELKFKDYFERLKAIVFTAGNHIDKQICKVDRVKINLLLQQPTASKDHHNFPHTDESDESQYSMVYYINDSDGDTFLFNEFYYPDVPPPNTLTISQRVSPRKNRAVIFESHRYHASSNPIDHANRFVINFVMQVA